MTRDTSEVANIKREIQRERSAAQYGQRQLKRADLSKPARDILLQGVQVREANIARLQGSLEAVRAEQAAAQRKTEADEPVPWFVRKDGPVSLWDSPPTTLEGAWRLLQELNARLTRIEGEKK